MSFGTNYNITTDLNELKRMINSFEDYLRRNELYGTIGGGFLTGGSNPQLTVGAVVMRLRRLEALRDQLNDSQQSQLSQLEARHAEIRATQSEPYLTKIEREAHSRLNAMERFFEECQDDFTVCPRIYKPEVLRRTIVQELFLVMEEADITSEELDKKARKTDAMLRRYITETDFVWDNQLKSVYPKETFWWMYMAPVVN